MIDLDQIVLDAQTRLRDELDPAIVVLTEADDREYNANTIRLVDLRLATEGVTLRQAQDYILSVGFEFECAAVNLTSYREASRARNELVGFVQDALIKQPIFTEEGDADQVTLGPVKFSTRQDNQSRAWTATAIGQVFVQCYADSITPIPVNLSKPTITGSLIEGQTLHGDVGIWDQADSFAFEWLRGSTVVAVTQNYDLTVDDVGSKMTFRVYATGAGGTVSADSNQSEVVLPLPPVNEVEPLMLAAPRVGVSVSIDIGSWSNNPTSFAYQWYIDNTTIVGATAISYTPVASDDLLGLNATVFAVNAGGVEYAGTNTAFVYDLDTIDYISRASLVDSQQVWAAQRTIKEIKCRDLWNGGIDTLAFCAVSSDTQAIVNVRAASLDLIKTGSPGFSPLLGIRAGGINNTFRTQIGADLVFATNSHVAVLLSIASAAPTPLLALTRDGSSVTRLVPRLNNSGFLNYNLNHFSTTRPATGDHVNSATAGDYILNRISPTSVEAFKNGVSFGVAASSISNSVNSAYAFRGTSSAPNYVYPMVMVGLGLDAAGISAWSAVASLYRGLMDIP